MNNYDNLISIWPEWRITELIGSGSYGKVYKVVRDEGSTPLYSAVKVITIPDNPSEILELKAEGFDEKALKEYYRQKVKGYISEIELMETFKGTVNVVNIEDYKVVEKNDSVGFDIYIRMELLNSFNKYIKENNLTQKEIIKLGVDICSALELFEQKNILHRDIKPENLFVSEYGDFKIGDLGIARKFNSDVDVLSAKGTYSYMAPEVVYGKTYNIRADIYSLGIVLYKLCNKNRLPFVNTDSDEIDINERKNINSRRFKGEKLPRPVNADDNMAAVILHACEYNPDERFQTPTEFKDALVNVGSGEKIIFSKKKILSYKLKISIGIIVFFIISALTGILIFGKVGANTALLQNGKSTESEEKLQSVTQDISETEKNSSVDDLFAGTEMSEQGSDESGTSTDEEYGTTDSEKTTEIESNTTESQITTEAEQDEPEPTTEAEQSEPEPTTEAEQDEPEPTTEAEQDEPETTTKAEQDEPETTTKAEQSEPEPTTEAEQDELETTTEIESNTETDIETEPEVIIEEYIVPKGCIYYTPYGSYSEGMNVDVPLEQGHRLETKDYIYTYGERDFGYGNRFFGWDVKVINREQTEYEDLLGSIKGEKLLMMNYTYDGCVNMKKAPKIPEGVENLYFTYSDCDSMEVAPIMPEGVNWMYFTFYNCDSLRIVPVIPGGVERMEHTFEECVNLETVSEISGSVKYWEYTFYNCEKLANIPDIPEGAYSLEGAFSACMSLKETPYLPEGVKNLNSAFFDCERLVKVTNIPDSVTDITGTFQYCLELQEVPELPKNITSLDGTFICCKKLTKAPKIPKGVTNLTETFWNCYSLIEAPDIPDSVKNMENTFMGCQSLRTAPVIPAGVINMSGTFSRCGNLTGEIVINANPTVYKECFYSVRFIHQNLSLTGTSTMLEELRSTSEN